VFRVMNHLAWLTEVVAAILMLIPRTRLLGAFLLFASFAFIALNIRLALLTEMVMLSCLLFIGMETLGGHWLARLLPRAAELTALGGPTLLSTALAGALCTYLALLPLAHLGLFYNFYGRRSFPQLLQRCLEIYTNFFGIIIWRVFSVDLVNFT